MMHMRRLDERGFTLIELLVVTAVIVIGCLFSVVFLLTPVNHEAQNANSERRAELAYIASGIKRYVADKGELPPDLPGKATAIGSYEDHYNLCKYLVPTYMKDIPGDPKGGIKSGAARCDKTNYATGYAVVVEKDGRITVSAPFSELDGFPAPKLTFRP